MKQTCCFLGISFNDYFLRGGLGSQIKEMLNILGYITSKWRRYLKKFWKEYDMKIRHICMILPVMVPISGFRFRENLFHENFFGGPQWTGSGSGSGPREKHWSWPTSFACDSAQICSIFACYAAHISKKKQDTELKAYCLECRLFLKI